MDFRLDIVECSFRALRKGVSRVAVGAAEVAGGEADEDARQPGERAFALQA